MDWEKAFDKIDQGKLIEALKRMDLPSKYIDAIKSLYEEPTFAVKSGDNESTWKRQNTGIRQGCPLSPYLFVIVMSVVMKDVHEGMNCKRGTPRGLDFNEILYADDTVLITNNVRTMNRLLDKTEKCAKYHGISFNQSIFNLHARRKTRWAQAHRYPVVS